MGWKSIVFVVGAVVVMFKIFKPLLKWGLKKGKRFIATGYR
jgi:hypothetical protein